MDPYLNLNNSGATNLTLGKNDLQEATVITNAYSGQYGQQAGVQVSYVTKSGTNQYPRQCGVLVDRPGDGCQRLFQQPERNFASVRQ